MEDRPTVPSDNDKSGKEQKKEEDIIKERERKIDEQLKQTFPASDPPSFIQPGNTLEEEE